MKKKTGKKDKDGNGKGTKRKTLPGAIDLLNMSDHLSGLIQKVEGPGAAAKWADKCLEQARALILDADGKKLDDWISQGNSIKTVQMLREAGRLDDDTALAKLFVSFIHMKDTDKTFPIQPPIMEKMEEFVKGIDPKNEKERLLTLGKGMLRLRFASVLKHHGEYGIADLVLNDPETFNRRFKEGALRFWKNDPEVKLDDEFFKAVAL